MNIKIRPMITEKDIEGKGRVQYLAWQEAYAGLLEEEYLAQMSVEECIFAARQHRENPLIAKDGNRVVGFAVAGACEDSEFEDTGEVYAVYVTPEYYGKGVGFALMNAAFERLAKFKNVILWVLSGNDRAIKFYKRYGFSFDGAEKEILLGKTAVELRMIYRKR